VRGESLRRSQTDLGCRQQQNQSQRTWQFHIGKARESSLDCLGFSPRPRRSVLDERHDAIGTSLGPLLFDARRVVLWEWRRPVCWRLQLLIDLLPQSTTMRVVAFSVLVIPAQDIHRYFHDSKQGDKLRVCTPRVHRRFWVPA
jgi:hypothetical protein